MKQLQLEGPSHHTIVITKINFAEGVEDTMSASETTEEYIKFDGNDKKKFWEWSIKTKAIRAKKGWVKALMEDLNIDQKAADDASRKAVVMNNLVYQHLVMSCMDKAFYYIQAAQDSEENGKAQEAWKELCHQYAHSRKWPYCIHYWVQCLQNEECQQGPYLMVHGTQTHSSMYEEGRGTREVRGRNDCADNGANPRRIQGSYAGNLDYASSQSHPQGGTADICWLGNAKYKNKIPVNAENIAMYCHKKKAAEKNNTQANTNQSVSTANNNIQHDTK